MDDATIQWLDEARSVGVVTTPGHSEALVHTMSETDYRGLGVADLTALRRALGGDATYAVLKSTLTKIAARDADPNTLDDLLVGPSAIAFVQGDPVEGNGTLDPDGHDAARGLRDFARSHPLLVIRDGVLDFADSDKDEPLVEEVDDSPRDALLASLDRAMTKQLTRIETLAEPEEVLLSSGQRAPSPDSGSGSDRKSPQSLSAQPNAQVRPVEKAGHYSLGLAQERTGFLMEVLGGAAALSRLLGVSRGQPSQWRSGKERPSPSVARELLDLDHVVARSMLVWPSRVVLDWLTSSNSYLDGARPVDVIRTRGVAEVIDALDAAASGAMG